ncbi:AAA family ATPase [Vannielia litorea]|uniref:AAA family ATPase n=1 Tax=Vannielia litorea TaxID=1217970 RepID=UPI001C9842E3|nr:AAA family ATPase [Vannielia litorea]MBY6153940.1 AAA family ATPase [Vannielia litorea]
MSYAGFQVRHLSYHGPNRDPAVVSFRSGLNVIYGASDTGKSFIVETIDFMLGGKGPLTDIPQSNGYAQILLALEFHDGTEYTVRRSFDGGAFALYEGLYRDSLPEGEGKPLGETHSERDQDNLSAFLLSKIGLSGKRVRKNAKGDTQNLSFRNLARLVVVNEEEIIQKRSPLSDGNYTADTANTSVFRLLLTGIDDSALVAHQKRTPAEQRAEAQIELLDQLISETRKRISQISGSKDELSQQEGKINSALETRTAQLSIKESHFKELSANRRKLMKRREDNRIRHAEISLLLERFRLLKQHYNSDLERLSGIREAGSIFSALEIENCPICGSTPEHHDLTAVCEGNVEIVIEAASSEIRKIEAKEAELTSTISDLTRESTRLEQGLPKIDSRLGELSVELETVVSPDLRALRVSYKELADKGANVREALGLFDGLNDLLSRKAALENTNGPKASDLAESSRLTDSMVEPFSIKVEELLNRWKFPGTCRVHFDLDAKDLVISGKPRTSFGKGLRAVTQSAFSLALLDYCLSNDQPHPGFVILDSPLLSYKEPEGAEDDLRDTDLNSNFYQYLLTLDAQKQVIVIENTDPPSDVELGSRVEHFSGLENEGRYGLFPVI